MKDFVKANPEAMLLTTDEHLESMIGQLPEGYEVLQEADYFLKNQKILLLGRHSSGLVDTIGFPVSDNTSTDTAGRSVGSPTRR